MPTEKYSNSARTFVAAGGYTSGSGVLNVDSTAAPFPQDPNFRVTLKDPGDGSVKVVLKVTTVVGGTQWNVVAEGSDASALEDDVAEHDLTAGAMDSIRSDMEREMTTASFDALASTEYKDGDSILLTDSVYVVKRINGAWSYRYQGMKVYRPPGTGWTNDQTHTGQELDYSGGVLHYNNPGTGGSYKAGLLYRTPPATPYRCEFLLAYELSGMYPGVDGSPGGSTNVGIGVAFGDGSSKIVDLMLYVEDSTGFAYGAHHWPNPSGPTGVLQYGPNLYLADLLRNPIWLALRNDGTNIYLEWRLDAAAPWRIFYQEAKAAYLSSVARVGLFTYNYGGPTLTTLISYREVDLT